MIQARVAILDTEIGHGLSTYLLHHPLGLTPVLCKNWEELRASKGDLALVGSAYWQDEEVARTKKEGIAVLQMDEAHLTPYQPADQLVRSIYQEVLEQNIHLPGAITALHEKEVVAICSPHGYDLQTGFAVVYSLIRAETVRTLCLDFTYYNGFYDEGQEDVGDLFYEAHKQHASMHEVLHAMIQQFGPLDYVPPVHTQMDLEDLTGEDITGLLQRILQESEYKLIVLNLPIRPKFLRAVYGCCSRMYSLQREGSLYERAQNRLLEDLRSECGQEELSGLQVVPMPAIGGSFSMDPSLYEALLFGEMASFVRQLLEE